MLFRSITGRVLTIFDFLNTQGVKAVVVACNTATAASIQIVRDKFNYPIIGMEPDKKDHQEPSGFRHAV